jgi:hypothetical protein
MKQRVAWWADGVPSVLIYGNRKQDDMIWLFTTPTERRAAILSLFRYLDTYWKVYQDLDDLDAETDKQLVLSETLPKSEEEEQRDLLLEARAGDADAAFKLLKWRNDSEYEEWKIRQLESND